LNVTHARRIERNEPTRDRGPAKACESASRCGRLAEIRAAGSVSDTDSERI